MAFTPSWSYPFYGIYYFLRHPFLWPLFRARLIPCLLLSIFVYANLFFWTYLPQVAFLALFHRQGSAFFNGAVLVLGEGAAIVALLFEAFLVDETQVDIFDAVLVNEGYSALVEESRPVDTDQPDSVKQLGVPTTSAIYAPFSLIQILEFIVLLPLNFIPYVGVPAFLLVTGRRAGPFHHWRYFALLDFSKQRRKEWIRRRRLSYTWFGTVAMILQLIPVLSMLFLLTTAAGAALWAVQLERLRMAGADPDADDETYHDDHP